jgi:hypothetical protein
VSWLEKNPVGAALLGAGGLLVLIGLGLTLLWRGPADAGDVALDGDGAMALPETAKVQALEPLGAYEIVNNRPVFNTTRRPVIEIETPEEVEEVAAEPEVVADPPKVRLTGVVITPTQRVVTLTPEAGGEALVVREGMDLDGEYVGWSVQEIMPREVSLLSSRGQQMSFELMVHDAVIDRPPEPEPRRPDEPEEDGEQLASADEVPQETRSRADEIRERIRQRREQLRAEAEQAEAAGEDEQQERAMSYQEAIQSMIRRNDNNETGNDDSDDTGSENDGGN